MNIWPHIFLFGAGIVSGIILYTLARMIESEGINHILDALARIVVAPFSLLGGVFRKSSDLRKARKGINEAMEQSVDPREQQFSDTAQAIRGLLLSIASVVQCTEQAASDSSQTLGDVRNTIDQMALPDDLMEVHTQLMTEIDRVISSNTSLKRELVHSQEILATQRQQIESLKTAVRIDGMTRLANRAYFDEKLQEMISLRQRYQETFSLLMIDVDNFKEINDTHGHQGGDRVLKGVAFKLKSALRQSDFVARFGGDEFAVILIKSGAKPAAAVAMKLCESVRESKFLLDGMQVTTTLSIGVAETLEGESGQELLKRADEALYRVKHSGRDGVSVADSTVQ
jgi:diguanylate cyclase